MSAAQPSRENGIATHSVGFAQAREELLRLARKRYYAALATSSPEGQPGAAPMRYAVTDTFELVMGTLRTSRKIVNLRRNPKVAIVVWDDEFSLQIEGLFDEPTGADLERLQACFANEFPREFLIREGRPNHLFFRVTPVWARYSDFMDEPGRVLTLDFVGQTETRGTWPVITT